MTVTIIGMYSGTNHKRHKPDKADEGSVIKHVQSTLIWLSGGWLVAAVLPENVWAADTS